MKRRLKRGAATLLTLCAAAAAFYLRAENAPAVSDIPVERVFVQTDAGYRERRDAQRAEEMQALTQLSDSRQAAEALSALVSRAENELAIENALAAMGEPRAVCALRREAAVVCLAGRLDEAAAQRVIELCARLGGVAAENVILLDECANL